MFKKMKLSVKLIGGFVMVAMVTLGVGYGGWRGVTNSLEISEKINYLDNVAKQILKREIDHLNWARKVGEFQRNENMTELGVEKDDHNCAFGKWYFGEERKKAEAVIPEIAPLLQQVEIPHRKLHESAKHLEGILKKGKEFRTEAVAYFQAETVAHLKEVQKILGEINPKADHHVVEAKKDAAQTTDRAKITAVGGMALGSFLALMLGVFLSRSITRPINRVVDGLNEGASQVASASDQVSSSSQSMAQGASEQAAAVEESSSSLEELASMTRQNAEHANQANILMGETARVVEGADKSMQDLIKSMKEVSAASEETAKIIKTIDEIAFQTNLLALNAAVEAARAGEAGAGFAVVADEVRNLAMRAAEAAKNTANLIETTLSKVKDGSDLVHKTGEGFGQVAGSTVKTKELVAEIAAASQEQAQGVSQISKAVAEMNSLTQQNAANAEESASASEELNAQAEQMKGYVQQLAAIVGGDQGSSSQMSLIDHRPSPQGGFLARKLSRKEGGSQGGPKFLPKAGVSPEKVIPLGEAEFKDF